VVVVGGPRAFAVPSGTEAVVVALVEEISVVGGGPLSPTVAGSADAVFGSGAAAPAVMAAVAALGPPAAINTGPLRADPAVIAATT
jgi:hypothetical protein